MPDTLTVLMALTSWSFHFATNGSAVTTAEAHL
jgi:hypothetical protein